MHPQPPCRVPHSSRACRCRRRLQGALHEWHPAHARHPQLLNRDRWARCPNAQPGRRDGCHVADGRPMRTPPAADRTGHGSHTAGTAGAVGNNGIGVTGVAWKVRQAAWAAHMLAPAAERCCPLALLSLTRRFPLAPCRPRCTSARPATARASSSPPCSAATRCARRSPAPARFPPPTVRRRRRCRRRRGCISGQAAAGCAAWAPPTPAAACPSSPCPAGYYPSSTLERNAIAALGAKGVLLVAAAGNDIGDNDIYRPLPAS